MTRAFLNLLLSVGALWVAVPASAAFEALGHGTQGAAVGDAYVVQAMDAGALWYNPAGLAQVERRQVLVDYARLFPGLDAGPDINAWTVSCALGLAGGRLGLGAAGMGADYYRENAAVLGYGRAWGSRLSLGVGVRVLRWSADGYRDAASGLADPDRAGTGLGADVGVRCVLLRWRQNAVSVGFSGQNLNEPDVSEGGGTGIPRRLVLGLGYEEPLYSGEADIEVVNGVNRVRVGGEYRVGGRCDLRLRAGASGTTGEGSAGELDGGLGLTLRGVSLNWAYHFASEIAAGATQRLSLGYQF